MIKIQANKTLILGDIHGNVQMVENFMHQTGAVQHITQLILLGDIGIGFVKRNNVDQTLHNLTILQRNLTMKINILLGNHDDRQTCADWFGVDVDLYGQRVSKNDLHWITDGTQIEIEDDVSTARLTFYGGATSIDQTRRKEGESWWATETRTNFEEVKNAIILDPVKQNILVTHDVSMYTLADSLHQPVDYVPSFSSYDQIQEAKVHHKKISELVDLGFDAHVHGHMHKHYVVGRSGVMFCGLANIDGISGEKFWLFGQELIGL